MKRIRKYLRDVYEELVHKVSWPSLKELQSSAIVVMVASLIIALIIYLMDTSFTKVMKLIYSIFY